jgi:DNA-binding MarR family transcriptional regulator
MSIMNGLQAVSQDLTLDEYRELAEFRHQIRCFESRSEQNAQGMVIKSESYLLLLAIQGLPEGGRPTIAAVAERLCLSPQAIDALVDEAVTRMDIIRSSIEGDGRQDWVKLTRTGRETLRRMAIANRDELERSGPELVGALQSVLKQRRRRSRGAA